MLKSKNPARRHLHNSKSASTNSSSERTDTILRQFFSFQRSLGKVISDAVRVFLWASSHSGSWIGSVRSDSDRIRSICVGWRGLVSEISKIHLEVGYLELWFVAKWNPRSSVRFNRPSAPPCRARLVLVGFVSCVGIWGDYGENHKDFWRKTK